MKLTTAFPIPRTQWSIEPGDMKSPEFGVSGSLPHLRLRVAGGFRPGFLYELIGECEGSLVQGVCYPAVRDLISFFKHDATNKNPLRLKDGTPAIKHAYGFGVSQSGRYLRNLLYLGFNADEHDRIVFDGIMPHVGGGGLGYFNHRFAQPTKFSSQHLEHLYPSDYFPFGYADDVDPHTKQTDGLQRRYVGEESKFLPKVMNTNGSGEYWNRACSLVHTDPLGVRDAEVPENVRLYTFGARSTARHMWPLIPATATRYSIRPTTIRSCECYWMRSKPGPARENRRRRASIRESPTARSSTGGARPPAFPSSRHSISAVHHQPSRLDLGPDFGRRESVRRPPKQLEPYLVKVPRVGPDGNELGTLLPIEVAVPTATYTG